jgi:hypothetical protein
VGWPAGGPADPAAAAAVADVGDASDERLADWRQIILAAGIEPGHVVVLDLDDAESMRRFQLAQEEAASS